MPRGLALVLFAMSFLAVPALAKTLVLQVETAHISEDAATGSPSAVVQFSSEGAAAFGDFTRKHAGQGVRLKVDGKVVSAPNIVEPILGGIVMISGNFTPESAAKLANALRTGKALVAETD